MAQMFFSNLSCSSIHKNGDVFYSCEPLRKVAGNLLSEGSLRQISARGEEDLWWYSSLPGDLLPVWECGVALLRERLLGAGGGFYSLTKNRRALLLAVDELRSFAALRMTLAGLGFWGRHSPYRK
jgi:hypothetical protein